MSDPLFAVTLGAGSSTADKTGSWRTERPVYVSLTPPCSHSCPAGEDVRGWLREAEADGSGYERAWRSLMATNPFPAVMGRICYHPCQSACNREELDESVGINAVERFIGDEALRQGWTIATSPPTGKQVLVVGAGPAGLSAAYHLARLGHRVTVKESSEQAGGMMRYGIPTYRLPRWVLDAEIERILALGVELELRATITDLEAELAAEHYDAVFLAVGAQIGRRAYLPAGTAAHVVDAISLLRDAAEGDAPVIGRHVAVYGGGDTALDAARTARRLGAADAVVVYRRTRDRMPAHESEVLEAEDEGVTFRWLSTVSAVEEDQLTLERMELDQAGFPQPTGQVETLSADCLVLALGQDTDLTLLDRTAGIDLAEGTVVVDDAQMTSRPGIFAGGDAAGGQRSATAAIGEGRQAAVAIDAWLAGRPVPREASSPVIGFDALNPWYYEDAPGVHRPRLEAARRASTFDEVVQGLDADNARYEARRCMSCGSCFSCDNCFAMCPDNAIVKGGESAAPYAFDLDFCKGCGLCATECPAGAIAVVAEDI